MSAKIFNIEDKQIYAVTEVICVKCGSRFICGRPFELLLKNLECDKCGKMGFIIETGEDMEKVDTNKCGVIEFTRKPM